MLVENWRLPLIQGALWQVCSRWLMRQTDQKARPLELQVVKGGRGVVWGFREEHWGAGRETMSNTCRERWKIQRRLIDSEAMAVGR